MMVQESQGTARCSNADALREVLARYDSSGRGVLSWTDVCTAYAGIYGVDVGSRPPLWKALATGPLKQTAAPAKDPNDALRACTVSIDDLVAHLIGGATKDEMELAQLRNGLGRHGYPPAPPPAGGCYVLQDAERAKERITFDTLIQNALTGKKLDKNQIIGATVTFTNAMIGLHVVPSDKSQELLGEVNRWTHMQKVWAEEAAAKELAASYFVDAQHASEAGAALLQQLFDALDVDRDGVLSEVEALACTLWLYDGVRTSDLDKLVPVSREAFSTFWSDGRKSNITSQATVTQFVVRHGGSSEAVRGLGPMTVASWVHAALRSNPATGVSHATQLLRTRRWVPTADVCEAIKALPAASVKGAEALLAAVEWTAGPAPALEDAAAAMRAVAMVLSVVGRSLMKRTDGLVEDPLLTKVDEHVASFVRAHPGELETALESTLGDAAVSETGTLFVQQCGGTTATPQSAPDSLWRTVQALDAVRLAVFALRALELKVLQPRLALVTHASGRGGAPVLAAIQPMCTPSLYDWIEADARGAPLADALPSDAELAAMAPAQVDALLAAYVGLADAAIGQHFASHSISLPGVSPGSFIVADAKLLVERGVKRHVLAAKLDAVLRLGRHAPDAVVVQRELGVNAADAVAVAALPVYAVVCPTAGHHSDVFHPHRCCTMQSYYLKGDHVRGSSECVLINRALVPPEKAAEWTEQAVQKKLAERLNAPKAAAWEQEPWCLYMSDMAPYLIRVGCCFEGRGVRYHVDASKLLRLMEPVLNL